MADQLRHALNTSIDEQTLQKLVVELATLCRWRHLHVRRSVDGHDSHWRTTTSIAGWPDLVLWKPGRFLAAELKSENGRLSAHQCEVLVSLASAGVDVRVWRPSDWPEIEAVLRGRSRLLDAWAGREHP